MFSLDDLRYKHFLGEWAEVLLTIPLVRAVYYVGTSAWFPSDGSTLGLQVVPNFIVRTDNPEWDAIDGMPIGKANHDLVHEADTEELQRFFARWHKNGWTPPPDSRDDDFIRLPVLWDARSIIRVIEVPANSTWAGPEYLKRIQDGVSVERIFQESLRRYNQKDRRLDPAAHYYSIDESESSLSEQ